MYNILLSPEIESRTKKYKYEMCLNDGLKVKLDQGFQLVYCLEEPDKASFVLNKLNRNLDDERIGVSIVLDRRYIDMLLSGIITGKRSRVLYFNGFCSIGISDKNLSALAYACIMCEGSLVNSYHIGLNRFTRRQNSGNKVNLSIVIPILNVDSFEELSGLSLTSSELFQGVQHLNSQVNAW